MGCTPSLEAPKILPNQLTIHSNCNNSNIQKSSSCSVDVKSLSNTSSNSNVKVDQPTSIIEVLESYYSNQDNDYYSHKANDQTSERTVSSNSIPKPIAYNITIEKGDQIISDKDNVLKRPLPKRLKHLEPLQNPPNVIKENLVRKMISAEQKRRQMLEMRRYPYNRQISTVSIDRDICARQRCIHGANDNNTNKHRDEDDFDDSDEDGDGNVKSFSNCSQNNTYYKEV